MTQVETYVAQGDLGHTYYALVDGSVYCQIHYPSGSVSDVREIGGQYPIERVVGQFDAEKILVDDCPESFLTEVR